MEAPHSGVLALLTIASYVRAQNIWNFDQTSLGIGSVGGELEVSNTEPQFFDYEGNLRPKKDGRYASSVSPSVAFSS